jgi:hypothetical protein
MGDALGQGHAPHRQLASRAPERDGDLGEACSGEVMRQRLGLGGLDVREALLDYPRDLAVQLLPSTLEQRVVRCVLHQRVLEGVGRLRWRASAKRQPRSGETLQRVL